MSRRRLARPGLSYFEANSGRLITETAEVLDAKAEIRKRWPNLDVYFDHETNEYVVVQKITEQGVEVERAFLNRPYCGQRLMDEITKADPTSSHFVDPEQAVDDHNAKVERERDRELEEISGEFGERLQHALKKDGFMDHEDIYGGRRVKRRGLRKQAINVGQRS
jgi:hypothetical protein